MKKKIVVLTGAGISAESGIKTFRDADGLWEGHNVLDVATPEGYVKNPSLVLDFYNQRRRQLFTVKPNEAHKALVSLEEKYEVSIITQNVDDLHERAGSSKVIHLHGELLKARSTLDDPIIVDCKEDVLLGDLCPKGGQLRPHIVWFGEEVPLLDTAMSLVEKADILIIIGTSMMVYPAASLVHYVPWGTPIYFVDPRPSVSPADFESLTIVARSAMEGVPDLVAELLKEI